MLVVPVVLFGVVVLLGVVGVEFEPVPVIEVPASVGVDEVPVVEEGFVVEFVEVLPVVAEGEADVEEPFNEGEVEVVEGEVVVDVPVPLAFAPD